MEVIEKMIVVLRLSGAYCSGVSNAGLVNSVREKCFRYKKCSAYSE